MRALVLFLVLTFLLSPAIAGAQQVSVASFERINETEGGFDGEIDDSRFARAVTAIGDVDGDGIVDIAVGAPSDGDRAPDDGELEDGWRGAVWILFMDEDSTVREHQKISETQGDFEGDLKFVDLFGHSLAPIGDLDDDGVPDLAVGADQDDDGGSGRGAIWILFLNDDGTVKSHQKISDTEGDFEGSLDNSGFFGSSMASLGDVDGDGVTDLAVGARGMDTVFVLFLADDGTVSEYAEISDGESGFEASIEGTRFGASIAVVGDIDGDGVSDLAVGADSDDDGGNNRGAVHILFMADDGTVLNSQKISDTEGGFTGFLDNNFAFGRSVAGMNDLNGDGVPDLAVGCPRDIEVFDDGTDRAESAVGSVWVLFLEEDGTVRDHGKVSDNTVGFSGEISDGQNFGQDMFFIADSNGDGDSRLIVGVDFEVFVMEVAIENEFLRGDADANGIVSALTDAFSILDWAFGSGGMPPCLDSADVDDNGVVSALVDALILLKWAFDDGDAPPSPGSAECGIDPTMDELDCSATSDLCG